MNWYAIHTQPRKEATAQDSLQREGLETFYPKLRRRKTIRRVRKWVTGPLFPRYIFARFDASKNVRLVKYANGISNIVSFGGNPAIVDDVIINTIRAHCTHDTEGSTLNAQGDIIVLPPPSFAPGDLVEIQAGPFQGFQGIFQREMSDQDRVVILLETLAKGARVEILKMQIEKI